MSFLLDSHTLLRAITDQKKLSKKVITILEDGSNEVFLAGYKQQPYAYKSIGLRQLW